MDKIIERIGETYRNKYSFSEEQIQRIQYTLKATWNELSKVLIYSVIFLLLGKTKEFFLVYFCLISLRLFEGGLHFKNYFSCLLSSFILICLCIWLPVARLPWDSLFTAALLSLTCILFFAPTLPKVRKLRSKKQFWILKTLASISTLIWLLIAKTNRDTAWSTSILYTVIFSNYQIIFSYFQIRNKKRR